MDDWLKSYYKLQKMDWSPTKLSDKEEKQFREWITGTKLFNNLKPIIAQDLEKPVDKLSNNEIIDEMLSSGDYDYRGAWKKGVTEEISPYDKMPHWSSKAPDTAWKELFMQQYGQDPDALGLDTLDKAIQAVTQKEEVVNPMYRDPFGDTTK